MLAVLLVKAACSSREQASAACDHDGGGKTSTAAKDFRLDQHSYHEGESFEDFYEVKKTDYAAMQQGKVPRATVLQSIEDAKNHAPHVHFIRREQAREEDRIARY
jgi:hypothetical protein